MIVGLRPRPIWVFLAAGALLTGLTILWVLQDTGIAPPTDSAHHLLTSVLFSRGIEAGGLTGLWQTMRHFYVGWPPASYLLLYGPLGWLFGDQSQLMRLYSLALLPLLLWGTYSLGVRLLGDRRLATLAALVCVFGFGVTGQLRQVSIDLPATGAVLLVMVALSRSALFSRPRWIMVLGAACGLCLFTRVQSVFFLAGPLAVQAVVALVKARDWRRRAERLIAVVTVPALAILCSAPWWFGRLRSLWKISTAHLDPGRVSPRGDPDLWAGLTYYVGALGKLGGWPLLLLALLAVPLVLWRPGKRRALTLQLLLPWLIGGVVGLAMGVHREPRYLLPAMPALALLACQGLAVLSRAKVRELAGAALLLAVALPTLLTMAWPVPSKHFLATQGLVEWAYVRAPVRVRAEEAGRVVAAALAKFSKDPTGAETYLIVQQHPADQFMSRLAIFLAPHAPRLLMAQMINHELINSPLHVRERKRRKLFVLAQGDFMLRFPWTWQITDRAYGNISPVRLYFVPPISRFKGHIPELSLPQRKKKQ